MAFSDSEVTAVTLLLDHVDSIRPLLSAPEMFTDVDIADAALQWARAAGLEVEDVIADPREAARLVVARLPIGFARAASPGAAPLH